MRAFFAALLLCLLGAAPAAAGADRWCPDARTDCAAAYAGKPAAARQAWHKSRHQAQHHQARKYRLRAHAAKASPRRSAAWSSARAVTAFARMVAPDPVPSSPSIVLASLHPAEALPSYFDDRALFSDDRRTPAALAQTVLAEADRWIGAGAREVGVRRDLWCAAFFNKILGTLGLRGTNSDLAASFARWGEPIAAPAPGAIAVKLRHNKHGRLVGGHVVIVKAVDGDRVVTISPNAKGNRVRLSTYPARVFYAYRMPAAPPTRCACVPLAAVPA